MPVSRRDFLKGAGAGALHFLVDRWNLADDVVEVRMRTSDDRTSAWFDPVGIAIAPSQTVRWVNAEPNAHTVTAYHPDNEKHPRRIPRGAEPWDSGYLVNSGATFEHTFRVEGVYDYYCKPHEAAGMVGRIVVGQPKGPGTKPFGYWRDSANDQDWNEVPENARDVFPSVDRILEEEVIRFSDV